MKLSRNAKRAVAKYGVEACLHAHYVGVVLGEGAHSIALCYSVHPKLDNVRAVDAAVNAGEELCNEMGGPLPIGGV